MRPRATLKDVAALAGVSSAAVSRHLNRSIILPPATVARIDAAIAELQYRPNLLARRLSLGRSDTIGVVLPEIQNPFFATLAAAAEETAGQNGFGVMLCVTANREARELDYLDRLGRKDVDALLFITNHPDSGALGEMIGRSPGIVLLDEDVAGTNVSKIFSDNQHGGAIAARHLIEAGHRRLAYVAGPNALMSSRERGDGFLAAAREAGIAEADVIVRNGDYLIEHGRQSAAALLDQARPPTAVFAGSDEILLGLLEVFRARQVRIPGDISLITFDDIAPLGFFDPPITAIRQSIEDMGRRGIERLVKSIKGKARKPTVQRLPVELVVRQSVAAPRRTRRLAK